MRLELSDILGPITCLVRAVYDGSFCCNNDEQDGMYIGPQPDMECVLVSLSIRLGQRIRGQQGSIESAPIDGKATSPRMLVDICDVLSR